MKGQRTTLLEIAIMKKTSLVRSLLLFSMFTSGVGLALFCAGFLVLDLHTFREKKVNDLKSTADLLSSNANSALGFSDSEAGSQVVEAMRVRPGIRSAVLYRLDDKILAWYVRRDLTGTYLPPKSPAPGVVWSSDSLGFAETVFLEGNPVGTLYIEDDLNDVHGRMVHFAWTSSVMALACLFFVCVMSLRLRRTIARPVYALAGIARQVASGNDYRLRAPQGLGGELGQLSEDFNHMLTEIERRDAELNVARETLEQRVSDRTKELESEIGVRQQTERRLLEAKEAAEAANRAKSEFLANMSHEIRTPLNGVMGMTDLVLESELTSEQRDYLDTVKMSADCLLSVINDILDFSKIEAGRIDLEIIDFNLRDCLEAALKTIALRADEKSLELLCEVAPDVPEIVSGDPSRLRQIVVNLVSNAIKFTSEGEVALKVQVAGTEVNGTLLHFTVSDTGIGIPLEKQKIIFEPFTQADASTTRRFGGTGLGLTISTRLVGMMNGKIWVESQPDHGTQFHFTAGFAVADARAIEIGSQAPPELLRGVKVLVVDDNRTNRRILDGMLQRWEMKPTQVESGIEALSQLVAARSAGQPYALVLTDMHMPHMDGFTLVERIRKRPELSTATIMMLTSAGHRGDAVRCKELGVSAYLLKPIRQSELREAIARVLGAREQKGAIPLITRYSLHDARDPAVALRILLAEDNPVNQLLAKRLLQKRGHHVTVAANGREALAAVHGESYDLVLMDVQMPEIDGIEATVTIRKSEQNTGNHLPVIALTAHAMKGDRARCLEAGMDGYLSKPIRPQELDDLLDSYVARRMELERVLEGAHDNRK
jgi:signal transduction histidine kinase/DNA-binding response OmpR family regulator